MLIDWFTVLAQIVNFLVLVWLLKRFLYKPILSAIDAREKHVVDQLAEAASNKAEAERQLKDLRRKNEVFEQQRDDLLRQAASEARVERRKLIAEAREEADLLRVKRQEMLRNEQLNLNKEIIRRTQQEVFAIAHKALADLAGTKLDQRMAEIFISRLHELSGEERTRLIADFASSSRPATLRSAFGLPESQRTALESAIKEVFGKETQVLFETSPDLVSGIELAADGHKVAWSIADYLTSLEKSISVILEDYAQERTRSDHDAA